ncbi:hypothetical protein GWI33_009067 [Rhynchophorus ferrugineus]|uniref:Uncharacterized protein n=1 Tax=Rhynchophorus ferrugineus TaxID=354439 RepID=A0A834IB68_RHYFE|nr:hypothetical protein GWI33_009067 [Rhynchophorus ferrugineus]
MYKTFGPYLRHSVSGPTYDQAALDDLVTIERQLNVNVSEVLGEASQYTTYWFYFEKIERLAQHVAQQAAVDGHGTIQACYR